jgi:glutamate-1-semialdehyde 2,1-aminomutase
MQTNWSFTELDARVAAELQPLLPEALYDFHAHLYRLADARGQQVGLFAEGPEVAGLDAWRTHVERQVGRGRLRAGLFFGYPVAGCDLDGSNQFISSELRKSPDSRGLILVAPDYPRANVEKFLANPQFVGLKPYHVFSRTKPTFQAPITDFLPEWCWQLAHERQFFIMLHMVRTRALADPDNQREIRAMCAKYPSARLILAHAARGFHSADTVNGIASLRGLENVWFDTSGICEPAAYVAILREFGPRRLLWGSDFPISERRGKCVTIGDNFAWINPSRIDVHDNSPACSTLLVGLESTRATLDAARTLGLNREDLADIFCNNALRLFGLAKETGNRTQELYRHARQRIPGGVQLLSKRPEMLAPDQWPPYFREARGCETWDLDGRHYYDMSTNAVGACLLGYRDPDVTAAVQRRVALGSISSLNPPEEVELADLLCEIHPWAQQARFARTGGEAMAVAVRIARATTDRSVIAICGYHGWQDWYLAANLGDNNSLRGHLLPGLDPFGVPEELRGTALPFTYNNREEFQKIIASHGNRLAAVVMEPCRNNDPAPGFLEFVRDEAHRAGALLIFDEITIGFRICLGGAHRLFKINPDIAVFAKTLGNGHPMSAIIGTSAAMDGAHRSFISSSYWTEGVGPAAALATIRKMQQVDVPAHVARIGTRVMDAWRRQAAKHRLPVIVEQGYPCFARFRFDHPEANELRTFYTQLMIERGFLAGGAIYPTLAHTEEIVAKYEGAMEEVFGIIATALAAGTVKQQLKGPPAHTGFRRLL